MDRIDAKGKLIPAIAGFDGTFSAPKSLSVWCRLTGDAGLLEAHDLAVRAVLEDVAVRSRRDGHPLTQRSPSSYSQGRRRVAIGSA